MQKNGYNQRNHSNTTMEDNLFPSLNWQSRFILWMNSNMTWLDFLNILLSCVRFTTLEDAANSFTIYPLTGPPLPHPQSLLSVNIIQTWLKTVELADHGHCALQLLLLFILLFGAVTGIPLFFKIISVPTQLLPENVEFHEPRYSPEQN